MAENHSSPLMAASLAAAHATGLDAELIRVCAEHIASVEAYNRDPSDNDADGDPLWRAVERTGEIIRQLPAETIAGVVAKARVARAYAPLGGPEEWETGILAPRQAAQVIDDLLRISGEGGL